MFVIHCKMNHKLNFFSVSKCKYLEIKFSVFVIKILGSLIIFLFSFSALIKILKQDSKQVVYNGLQANLFA